MLKNKVLLLAALFFVGVSFCSENEEQDPTIFQRMQSQAYSACKSSIVPMLAIVILKRAILSSLDAGYLKNVNPVTYVAPHSQYVSNISISCNKVLTSLVAYNLTRFIPGQSDITRNICAGLAVGIAWIDIK